MAARARKKPLLQPEDARRWRRFINNVPPNDDLIEIKRLHDNKTILRRRTDLPPSFPTSRAEWRPV